MRLFFLTILSLAIIAPAHAQIAVIELFTTSACAPCHPADELLFTLQKENPGEKLIALSCHIPSLGDASIKQNLALQACDERQSYYYRTETLGTASTPTAIINGLHQAIGSDEKLIRSGIKLVRSINTIKAIKINQTNDEITINLPEIQIEESIDIWAFSSINQTTSELKDGTILNYAGLIKDMKKLTAWDGKKTSLKLKTENLPADTLTIIAQKYGGEILAAGKIELTN